MGKSLWTKIVQAGIEHVPGYESSKDRKSQKKATTQNSVETALAIRRLQFTNRLFFGGAFLFTISMIIDFQQSMSLVIFDLCSVVSLVMLLLLNKRGIFYWTRVLGLFLSTLNIYLATTILGRGSFNETILPLFSICSFLLFEEKNKRTKWIMAAIPLIAFLTLELTDFYPVLGFRSKLLVEEKFLNIVIDFIFAIMCVLFYETETKDLLKSLDEERARSAAAARLKALGEMSAGVAHEVNNPLAIINGRAMILEGKLQKFEGRLTQDEIAELTELSLGIQKTVMRASRIVKALRTLSREAGSSSIFNFNTCIEDTLFLCNERFTHNGIKLTIENNLPDDFTYIGDQVQISQVLVNLLSNSFDAIVGSSSPWVTLSTKIENNELLISVKDSGKGIAKEIRDKIFQPFYTTKEIGKGTGLGLSLAKTTIEQHGGKLVYDESSANTCFIIHLPIRSA